jgi:hypothetical protein
MSFAQFRELMPDIQDFDRMQWCGVMEMKDFNEFVDFNFRCYTSAQQEERDFISMLCKNIKDGRVGLTDLENCVEFRAYGVYFNENRKIIIFNQR